MAEELLPINNISYHFVKTVDGCTSEKVIKTSITCRNFDELLSDLKSKKEFIHKNKYSDIYITCSSMNKDLFTSSYLWHTDYVNSDKIYKLTLFDIIMHSKQSAAQNKEATPTPKPVSSVPKKEPVKDTKPAPVNTLPDEPKETTRQANTLPDEPKETKATSSGLRPEGMNMSDIFKILSQRLPVNTEEEKPTTFNPKQDDDIVITSNRASKPKEPKSDTAFEKQLEEDQPEFKCFKVSFDPEDKPVIEEVPFKVPEPKPEKKPESKPEKKPESKPEYSEAEAFLEFLRNLSQMMNEPEKKPETEKKAEKKPEPEKKPETAPKDKLFNPFMMGMPWTMRQDNDPFMRLFSPFYGNNEEEMKLARERSEKVAREKARIARERAEKLAKEKAERERIERLARERAERIAKEKAERERIERLARERAEKIERDRERIARENAERMAQEKARKRVRDPFMEMFPFLI